MTPGEIITDEGSHTLNAGRRAVGDSECGVGLSPCSVRISIWNMIWKICGFVRWPAAPPAAALMIGGVNWRR